MATIINGVEIEKLYVRKKKTGEDVELKYEGKSEQLTTNGYQLFDASRMTTKTQGGATITNNGDGSFTISGSGSLTETFSNGYGLTHAETVKLLKSGVLTFKCAHTNPRFYLTLNGSSGRVEVKANGSTTITDEQLADETFKLNVSVYGSPNSAIVEGTIKPMLYQDGDGTWEPFTGGKPSPSPQYPQEITNTVIDEIVEHGNNLLPFPYSSTTSTISGITFTVKEDGGVDISGISTAGLNFYFGWEMSLKKGTYTLSGMESFSSSMTLRIYDHQNKVTLAVLNPKEKSVTFTLDKDCEFVNVYLNSPNTNTSVNTTIYPMLNEGTDAIPYEPYWEKAVKLSEPIELCGIEVTDETLANYVDTEGKMWCCDEIDVKRGVFVQRVGKIVFDGNEKTQWLHYVVNEDSTNQFYIEVPSCFYIKSLTTMSDQFIGDMIDSRRTKTGIVYTWSKGIGFNLDKTVCPNTDLWKEMLRNNPVTAYYILTTPIETSLSTEDKIALIDLQATMNGYELYDKLYINDVLVFSTEMFVFKDGILNSDVTNNGFTIQEGYLWAGVGADNDESEHAEVKLLNIDMTNFSKVDIELDYNAGANYGSADVKYGIDATQTYQLDDSDSRVSTTITMDISTYTGTHWLGFYLYAKNKSSEPTWGAWANVWIKSIKLYN